MRKKIAGIVAGIAMGTAALTGCGSHHHDAGYEQVWYNGSYQYVPYDYYHSHMSLYNNHAHPAHHFSSSYVNSHHVTVQHQTTTTTVHRNGSRTTTRRTTTTTHHSSGRTLRSYSRRH